MPVVEIRNSKYSRRDASGRNTKQILMNKIQNSNKYDLEDRTFKFAQRIKANFVIFISDL